MSRFAPKHRRDANQGDIIKRFEQLGCSVQDTSQVGDKFWDLVVGIFGRDYGVEVKEIGKQLSGEQADFHRDWRGQRPTVIWTPDQCEPWVNAIRKRLLDRKD